MSTALEPIALPQRIEFMKKIHLFYQVEEDQFDSIAPKLKELRYKPGEVIIRQGQEGDRFFMIHQGTVNVTRTNPKGEQSLAKLVTGDYFGEESLLTHHRRNATVTAIDETVLLSLSREDFSLLLKKIPRLNSNFAVAVNSHRLARKMSFKWLRENEDEGEVIYFLARKHPILLVRALVLPTIAAFIALIGIVIAFNVPSNFFLWLFVAALGLIIGWGFWNGIDWGNDYYIVTNQRVVWLEKVVGIYDSRQEAPLSAIQRINVQTDYWGRQLNYGTLIVRTIVGSTLTLRNVDHPAQAAALIEEHWKRSKQASRKMEEGAMRQALRQRILHSETVPEPVASIVQKLTPAKKPNPYAKQSMFANFFRVRFEALTTITYRKHWVVLVERTWIPGLILWTLFGWLVYEIFSHTLKSVPSLLGNRGVDALLVVWLILFAMVFSWWYYEYINWSNDIFQVTPDQILDINKTPLGEVTSDIAALDNILHLEYERRGIMQILFNYGNVYITIGGGKDMTFENVFNPSAVQDDIERRRLERLTKKEQESVRAERERMADWFAAYHRSTGDLPLAEDQEKKSDGSKGN
jgi:CRP-like cAMP-binding protein